MNNGVLLVQWLLAPVLAPYPMSPVLDPLRIPLRIYPLVLASGVASSRKIVVCVCGERESVCEREYVQKQLVPTNELRLAQGFQRVPTSVSAEQEVPLHASLPIGAPLRLSRPSTDQGCP